MATTHEILKRLDAATAETDNKIAAMYRDGFHTLSEVARAMNTTRTRVMVALYRMNLLPDRTK